MPSPVEGTSRRSSGAASLPLQFRQASSSIEIGTGSQNTSPASWIDQQGADLERDLLIEASSCLVEQSPVSALRLGPPDYPCCSGSRSGRLATIDDGRTWNR